MKTPKQFWKVLLKPSSPSEPYQSVCYGHKYALKYEIGKPTVPIIGKIFVFSSRENARRFRWNDILGGKRCVVAKVNVKNPTLCNQRADVDSYSIFKFWVGNLGKSYFTPSPTPKGTFVADEVTVTEIVE